MSLYVIQKPLANAEMVERFISALCRKYDVYIGDVDVLKCQFEPSDIKEIYSDHLEDDFYPDLETFMCCDDSVIYEIPIDDIPWDEITDLKKFFRMFLNCETNTPSNHIHIAENDEMNEKIRDIFYGS